MDEQLRKLERAVLTGDANTSQLMRSMLRTGDPGILSQLIEILTEAKDLDHLIELHQILEEKGFNVLIPTHITDEQIKNLLCAGIEGGIGYWAQIIDYQFAPGLSIEDFREGGRFQKPGNYWHPSEIIPLFPGCAVIFQEAVDPDFEPEGPWILDREAINRGLQLLSQHPRHFRDFVEENEDAITGDVFIQLCLFGNIVYG